MKPRAPIIISDDSNDEIRTSSGKSNPPKDPCDDWTNKLKKLLKAIAKTMANIDEHEDWIQNGKNGDRSGISIDHWKKEQNAFKKNLKDFNGAKDYLEDECDGK